MISSLKKYLFFNFSVFSKFTNHLTIKNEYILPIYIYSWNKFDGRFKNFSIFENKNEGVFIKCSRTHDITRWIKHKQNPLQLWDLIWFSSARQLFNSISFQFDSKSKNAIKSYRNLRKYIVYILIHNFLRSFWNVKLHFSYHIRALPI